jgi:hypothetical protein
MKGSDGTHEHHGGTYYLTINSVCSWTVASGRAALRRLTSCPQHRAVTATVAVRATRQPVGWPWSELRLPHYL